MLPSLSLAVICLRTSSRCLPGSVISALFAWVWRRQWPGRSLGSRARRLDGSSWGFQIAPVFLERAERRSLRQKWCSGEKRCEKVKSPTCDSCLSDDAKHLLLHVGVVAEFFPGALYLHLLCQGHQLLLVRHHEADHVRLVAVEHAFPIGTDSQNSQRSSRKTSWRAVDSADVYLFA